MQKNDMARKVKVEIDGNETPNLVLFGGIERSQVTVEVPSFEKLRTIITGVDTIPPIDLGFKFTRNSNTQEFFKDWYTNKETKDVVAIEMDGTGSEISRMSLLQCECSKFSIGEYAAESPTYYRIDITILPYEIEFI